MPGNTGHNLLFLLEHRLGTVVSRLGVTHTRPMARQLVAHRHVLVNGRRVNIPSYGVQIGDIIQLTEKATEVPGIHDALTMSPTRTPSWLMREGSVGQVIGSPQRGEVNPDIQKQLIVEFHSQ